jgi:hypothetical protein
MGTLKIGMKYTAILIGTYLIVAYASGFGTAIKSAGQAGSGFAKTLQARA